MRGGRLNKRITIQKLVDGQDAIGQPGQEWVDHKPLWASIKYLNGIQTIKANGEKNVAMASIRIRLRTDITPDMRVLYGTTIFSINAVLPDEEGDEYLDLACETGANEG